MILETEWKIVADNMNSIIEECLKEGRTVFYIYPYGNVGMQVEEILVKRYGIKNIVRVDNCLCEYNKKVLPSTVLQENEWKDTDIVLVASNSYEYHSVIRLTVNKYVPSENVKDLFPLNPLLTSNDQRVASLAAVAREIYRKGIQGCVAEAGVYRGEFAKFINVLFADRKLYLFDSFEGFDRNSVVDGYDNCKQTDSFIERLKDTSVDVVMSKMTFKQNIVIKKGYVPQTLNEVDERFCFVNLDMDLYEPTYESLNFFWDHMNAGGYIFVHDFYVWSGIEPAVEKFCKEKQVGYMCLTDKCSIVIAKPIQ